MSVKQLTVGAFAVLFLAIIVIAPLTSSQSSNYDPWLDYNEDGKIDVNELNPLGQAYGATGDPTKNVNVTNWPVMREPFPENLILKGTYYSAGVMRHELLDATTASKSPYVTNKYEISFATVGPEVTLVYNKTFIYEKVPTSAYRIFGTTTVTAIWNVTNSPAASNFYVGCSAYLGRISMSGVWKELAYLGMSWRGYGGALDNYKAGVSTCSDTPINVTINANERLAIRTLFYGYTLGGTTNLTFEILLDTNDLIVDIPIVKNA